MSPKTKPTKPIDVYARVSRVNGRDVTAEGGTASEQERRCRAQLEALGLEAGEVFTDLDESGGKESRPAYDRMKERISTGHSGGVIVWKLSRFGRKVQHVLRDIQWIEAQGAAFICVEPMIDTSTPTGRFTLTVFAALDELELDERRAGWDRAREGAVSRGIHVAATVPAGYARDPETRRLVRNGGAEAITEAFRLRAKGASLRQVAEYLTSQKVRTSHAGRTSRANGEIIDGTTWSARAAQLLLRNRVYLGEARSGEHVHPDAHEALVTPAVFSRVQAMGTRKEAPGRRTKTPQPLRGLVRCASCGHAMKRDSTTLPNGKGKYWFYRCTNRDLCEAPASVSYDNLTAYVEGTFLEAARSGQLSYTLRGPRGASVDTAALDAELLEAEEELRLYVETTSIAAIGAEAFRAGLEARQGRVSEAQRAVAEAAPDTAPLADFEARLAERFAEWGDTAEDVREFLSGPAELADGSRSEAGGEFTVKEGGRALELRGEALAMLWQTQMPAEAKNVVYSRVFEKIEVSKGRAPVSERVKLVRRNPA